MRIIILGHSSIHIRQHIFAQEIASQGHDVLQICSIEWGNQTVMPDKKDRWELLPLPYLGDGIYNFFFANYGISKAFEEFKPDWVYCQQEPGSILAEQAIYYAKTLNSKAALFLWENMSIKGGLKILKEYDLVICGNDKAQELVKPYAKRTIILPQVGLDTNLFKPIPEIKKTVEVGFVGRNVPEKGIPQLMQAWPEAKQMPWEPDYLKMPQVLNQAKMIVCFSQDSEHWLEQAGPYVSWEANLCGVTVIVSDSGSIPFWHTRYADTNPGVWIVKKDDISGLAGAIRTLINQPAIRLLMGTKGRKWVQRNLSNQVVVIKLMEAFNA